MAKEKKEMFSPEFDKVLEAIDNWKEVNSEGKSFIASFLEEDEEGYAIGDTVFLAFGHRDACTLHLEQFKKALDDTELEDGDEFMDWSY